MHKLIEITSPPPFYFVFSLWHRQTCNQYGHVLTSDQKTNQIARQGIEVLVKRAVCLISIGGMGGDGFYVIKIFRK
jgi:hypothetical protein